jgi:hypothetical protein
MVSTSVVMGGAIVCNRGPEPGEALGADAPNTVGRLPRAIISFVDDSVHLPAKIDAALGLTAGAGAVHSPRDRAPRRLGGAGADAARRRSAPSPWSAGARAVFGRHRHPRPKRLFVVEGSISFDGLPLATGEGIRIPAGVEHSAVAGDRGVRCVEAFE